MVSTTMDYVRFCQMLLNTGKIDSIQILEGATIDLMFTDHLGEVREHQERVRLPLGEASFGIGFSIQGNSPDTLEEIYGWGGAADTYFKIYVKNKLVYVLMIQLSPYRQLNLRQLF